MTKWLKATPEMRLRPKVVFPNFKQELSLHAKGGYHSPQKVRKRESKYAVRQLDEFITEIGTGRYFGGNLVILEADSAHRHEWERILLEARTADAVVFGYDGTTSGCYFVNRGDTSVYWFDFETAESSRVHESFRDWIEQLPKTLFDQEAYRGYSPVKDRQAIDQVIRERAKFQVRVELFDKALVRPPGRESDFLPRFHRVNLSVNKVEASSLDELTVSIKRLGSYVGDANMEFVPLDVKDIEVGVPRVVECYVFDPFNAAFDEITCDFSPNIDLSDPSRVRFVEIRKFL